MGFVIWVIIIICIVWVEVNKQKKRNQGTRPNVPRNPQTNYGRTQQAYRAAQPNYHKPQQTRANGQRPAQGHQVSRQRMNGQRPVQGGQRPQNVRQPNDILSRATANVQENDGDMLEMQMTGAQMMTDAHALVHAIDIGETSELMREVNDLMITGYQADLAFERDFVAEGVEVLNRFELPTEA